MLASSYNNILVIASLITAILASYTALNMAGRVSSARGRAAGLWLVGGSFAMGFGIWSMHFIGMLAFSLPIPLGYDLALTTLSLAIAVGSSAFALWLVCQSELPFSRLCIGAILMGTGIAAMHYTGMAAMLMEPGIVYIPWLFVLSILIAIVASGAALWIAFRLRADTEKVLFARIGASLVMGCAIVGMHYTGMAAAEFPIGSICGAANSGMDSQWMAILVIVVSLAVFAIALIISMLDVRTSILANSLDQANSELIHLALHDTLTQLPNRILLNDRLEHAVAKAARKNSRFALFFMDLDGFKAINDVYGHHVGDELLIQVAARITDSVRQEDTVARLGGDEFVVLIESGEPEESATLAQRLIEDIAEPYLINGIKVQVSTSIGVALFPDDGADTHELMVNADAAMYHAKQSGRNDYYFFEKAMNEDAHRQLHLQQDMRVALHEKQFLLHYQPKFRSSDGAVIGLEALLRWERPGHGLVRPDEFLPLAERTGLIIPIGNWVIEEACRQMRALQDDGFDAWSMAVNISSVQLQHDKLVEVVKAALDHNRLAPQHLILEITETTAMADAEASLNVLERLTELGVNVSIDDFGTGYSSLLYLKRLPANELKIDRGFVSELVDRDDEAIVSAIIGLGKTLGLKIVAEGVETEAQQQLLSKLGCDTLQGFHLGVPTTAEMLLKDLESAGHLTALS